jgi:Flp pilus assembly protein TadD
MSELAEIVDQQSSKYNVLFRQGANLAEGRVNLDGNALGDPGFFERRRLRKALGFFALAAQIEPPYGAASLFAAKIEERLGNSAECVRWLRKAQVTAPGNVIVAIELGGALSRHGLHVEAIEVLSNAAQLFADDPRVHCNLGVSLLLAGDTRGSIAAFERLVSLEPGVETNLRLLRFAVEVAEGRTPGPRSEEEIARGLS